MDRQNDRGGRKKAAGTAAALLGAGLLAAWIITGENGPSEKDIEIYEQAAAMQEQVDGLGFLDFRLEDYPVAVYDGRRDYVFYEGKIKKRAPVLETFAGTVYPVEGHFEVVVPTAEQMDKLLSLAGGVEGMVSGSGYGSKEQTATIWHEAFHAYQLTNYAILGEKVSAEDLRQDLEGDARSGKERRKRGREEPDSAGIENEQIMEEQAVLSEEEWIVQEVDNNAEIRKKLETELELLEEAAGLAFAMEKADQENAEDMEKLKKTVFQYLESHRQRLSEMPRTAADAEIRCELTEGTAYYVESKVYGMQAGDTAYQECYLDGLGRFEGGRGKYYRTGMAKCVILDQIAPDWKEELDFTQGMDAALEHYSTRADCFLP